MNLAQWIPAIVAIGAIVGNAYVTYVTAARHEGWLERHNSEISELKEDVAVLKDRGERR